MISVSLIAAWGLFLFGLSSMGYVGFRFLSLVISLEVGILKEFKGSKPSVQPVIQNPDVLEVAKNFAKGRFEATDGTYIAQNDETQFIQEQVENLRKSSAGLTEEELDAFVRQAVSEQV